MPPAKLPKPLSRFIGGFRGVGQTSSLAITCALPPTFADIDRGTQGRYCTEQLQEQGIQGPEWRCEALEDNVGSAWLPVCRLRSLPKELPGFVGGVQGVRQDSNDSSHNLSAPSNIRRHQSRRSTQELNHPRGSHCCKETKVLEDDGSAWLPACHLRSLPKGLSGFIAGIQGVKRTCDGAKPRPILNARSEGLNRLLSSVPKEVDLTSELQFCSLRSMWEDPVYRMGDTGSAWLPVCHLRSLSKDLPGFIAGIQGVKQTFYLRHFCSNPADQGSWGTAPVRYFGNLESDLDHEMDDSSVEKIDGRRVKHLIRGPATSSCDPVKTRTIMYA